VVRNDAYAGTKAKVQEIDFKIYQDQETAFNDLLAGNLDVQPQIPSSKLSAAKTSLGARMKQTPSSVIYFLTVPSYDPAFKKIEIRQAISMAIDRQQIIDKIFQGAYTNLKAWVSSVVQGARPDTCGDTCAFNPTKAKEMFTAAGGVPGNKIALYYNADGAHKEWVEAVCNQLHNNLGVTCTPSPIPTFADMRKQARAHTLKGLMRGGWSFDYPSIEDYLTPLYKTGASSNDSQYANPTFDSTLANADKAATSADAIKGYQDAEDIIAKDLPTLPMWTKNNIFGISTAMTHVDMDLYANVEPRTLEKK